MEANAQEGSVQNSQIIEFVLTGALAGKTVLLNSHSFIRGTARILVQPEGLPSILTYMSRAYQAYPAGSEELKQAQARAATALAEKRKANGLLGDIQENTAKSDGAPAPVQSAGDPSAGPLSEARAIHGSVDASGSPRSEGLVPGGPGYADARMGEGMDAGSDSESDAIIRAIRTAVEGLDPREDAHWSEERLPSVEVIAATTSIPNISRQMIELAAPGWNRDKAEDLAGL